MLKWSSNFPGTDNTVTLGQGREGWENYLLLEKMDEAKGTTWKQYAGSNRLSCHCHRVFSLQVPAIYGVDTRMLTKIIRDKVWPSSLAECVPLLISPRAWRTHWSAEEESWPPPLVISISLSFPLLMWFPGLNPGCPWDPLTCSGFIECLLCVDYDDNKARHWNSAHMTSLWWNRKSVYRVCNSLTKPESSTLKNAIPETM